MSRLPITALDTQLDLLRHYTKNEYGRLYADSVVDAALYGGGSPGQFTERAGVIHREEIGYYVHRAILTGDTYAITSDIVDVLEQMSPSLPRFILHEDDLPTPHGFVWLEQSIVVPDVKGRNLVVRAFGWNTADVTFTDPTSPDEGERDRAALMLAWTDPRDPRDHAYTDWKGTADDPDRSILEAPSGLLSMLCGVWPLNKEWDRDANAAGIGPFWLTFLRFLATPWIATDPYTPERHQGKRALRQLEHVPKINVVQLRRRRETPASSEPGTIGNVDWSHRWIVSPHWRDQWYPSLNCHKPILIAEYIKGPEHLPLVVNDRVFSVER
jgi:hypothetical protein